MKENTTEHPWKAIANREDMPPIHERVTVQSDNPPLPLGGPQSYSSRFTGKQIGNYRVEQPLGHGGFGSVFKAYDEKSGRHVAIKFLHPTIDERHRQLFEREARAIGSIIFANIVKIFEYGEFDGQNYFVLEYVAQNVTSMLQVHKTGLPVKIVHESLRETADALAFAHERGSSIEILSPQHLAEGDGGAVKASRTLDSAAFSELTRRP